MKDIRSLWWCNLGFLIFWDVAHCQWVVCCWYFRMPIDAICNSEQSIIYVYYYLLQPTFDIKRLCKILGLFHGVVWGFLVFCDVCAVLMSNLLLTFWHSMLMPSSNLLTLEGRTKTSESNHSLTLHSIPEGCIEHVKMVACSGISVVFRH
jgi:hypothetical protein